MDPVTLAGVERIDKPQLAGFSRQDALRVPQERLLVVLVTQMSVRHLRDVLASPVQTRVWSLTAGSIWRVTWRVARTNRAEV